MCTLDVNAIRMPKMHSIPFFESKKDSIEVTRCIHIQYGNRQSHTKSARFCIEHIWHCSQNEFEIRRIWSKHIMAKIARINIEIFVDLLEHKWNQFNVVLWCRQQKPWQKLLAIWDISFDLMVKCISNDKIKWNVCVVITMLQILSNGSNRLKNLQFFYSFHETHLLCVFHEEIFILINALTFITVTMLQ